jgi:hypothetical protein
MKKAVVIRIIPIAAVLVGLAASAAEGSALLNFRTGTTSVLCDTRVAFSAANCGAGYTVAGDTIAYVGPIGTWQIDTLAVTSSNTPGITPIGKINLGLVDVRHLAGTDDLTVDFGHDGFSAPTGPSLFTATGAASSDQALVGDRSSLTGYARAANDLALVPPTSATALDLVTHLAGCTPAAGPTKSCAMVSPAVPFTTTGPFYSLAARAVIQQQTSTDIQWSYLEKAAVQPVPEPASILLLAAGLLALAARWRRVH